MRRREVAGVAYPEARGTTTTWVTPPTPPATPSPLSDRMAPAGFTDSFEVGFPKDDPGDWSIRRLIRWPRTRWFTKCAARSDCLPSGSQSRPQDPLRVLSAECPDHRIGPTPASGLHIARRDAALLGFFEVRFARKGPGGLVDQELISPPRAQVNEGALRLSLPGGLVDQETHFAAASTGQRGRASLVVTDQPRDLRRQLVQQRLGLLQIARVEPFGEPAVDRS